MPDDRQPWFVVVDPQRIFADPTSDWAAPRFGEIVEPARALASAHAGRTLVTRWLPGADRAGSWRAYFDRWQFADRPDEDPLLDLVPQAEGLTERPTIDVSTFGKWSPALQSVVGHHAHLVLAGVATDCCVISTALAAADAGCFVTVVPDACAGSTDDNHAAALQVMGLYEPQIRVRPTADVLADR